MTTNVDKLIRVLDMPDHKQDEWCSNNATRMTHGENLESLADLAFRLRDDVVKLPEWRKAKELVWIHCGGRATLKLVEGLDGADEAIVLRRNVFFVNDAEPMQWIIAALIAKQLKEM